MPGLADLDLWEAADLLAHRETSAVALTQACLSRVRSDRGRLNAFIWTDEDDALKQAEAADQRRSRGEAFTPLLGIPLAHKDMFENGGRRMTCGSGILRDHRPQGTASVMARLNAAGAVNLGGLHMAEFAQGPTGHNRHYGDARNPWNGDYITGGSSSGSGCAVAARMTFGSLASDTGGSVRLPAACCGVTGLKPTYGRVSRRGAMLLSWSMDCLGVLARSARDCALLLHHIAGHDPRDGTSSARPVPPMNISPDGDLRGLRIGIPAYDMADGADDEVRVAFEAAIEVLHARGATTMSLDLPAMDRIAAYSGVVSRVELGAVHARWMRDRPQDYGASVSGRMYPAYAVPGVLYAQALRHRGAVLRDFCEAVFGKVDVIACPTMPRIIPTRAETDIESGAEGVVQRFLSLSVNTRAFSFLGLPAVSLPCGFDRHGLPIGFQLAGRPFAEARLLAIGHAFQRDTSWHRFAPDLWEN